MRVDRLMGRGRRLAEARMLDLCRVGVERPGPKDPITLLPSVVFEAAYSGRCRVSSNSNAVSSDSAGGQQFVREAFQLSVPVAKAGGIRPGMLVVIDGVDPKAGNPAMVGRRFRVEGTASTSQATAARYGLELIS